MDRKIPITVATAATIAIVCPAVAFADIADTQAELSAAVDELEQAAAEADEARATCDALQVQIDDTATQIEGLQVQWENARDDLNAAMVMMYKEDPLPDIIDVVCSAESLDDLLHAFEYRERIERRAETAYIDVNRTRSELDNQLNDLRTRKETQESAAADLETKKNDLAAKVTELKDDLDRMSAEQQATFAAADALASSQLFASGDVSGWRTGIASAYGGHSDPTAPVGSHTATGAVVTESSMGVAVPMAWDNFRSYFGRKVEISYNGQSVIATVNDCGGMGGGSRSLDLQPGVFRAFGCTTCDQWGLRTVSFRFL